MQFLVLVLALCLATGVAGLRLSFRVHRRIRAVQRLFDNQMDGARRRIAQLEDALVEADAARLDAQDGALQERRRHADLMAAVGRQMRSPLEGVLGFSDLLRLNAAGEPLSHRQRQAVERIGEGAARLRLVIEGMNALAGVEQPGPSVTQPVDPLLLAHRICGGFAEEARSAGVTLTPPSPQPGLAAAADPARLSEVLAALIANAVRHNRPGGTVTIEGVRSGAEVPVTVRDTGPGLSSARLKTVFEPFADVDDGLGVVGAGLAAAHRLVWAMQGRLEAVSVEGCGAAFTLSLPAAFTEAPPETDGTQGFPPDLPRLPQGVLLYVARDAAAVALMRRLTQDFGRLQLHVATSPDEGSALARDLRPDALILDLDLVDDGGAAFLADMNAVSALVAAPVLALGPGREGRAAEGFAAVLSRPVSVAELAGALARLLRPQAADADRASSRRAAS